MRVFQLDNTFRYERHAVNSRDADAGKASVVDDTSYPLKKFAKVVGGPEDTLGLPIIPLVERLVNNPIEIGPDDLPDPGAISREALKRNVRARVEKVVSTLVDVDLLSETNNMATGFLLRLGARQFGAEVFSKKANAIVDQAIRDVQTAFAG